MWFERTLWKSFLAEFVINSVTNPDRTLEIIWSRNTFKDIFPILVTFVARLWQLTVLSRLTSLCIMLLLGIRLFPIVFFKYFILGSDITNPEDFNRYIVVREDSLKKYACGICRDFCHQSRANVRNHLESKHFQGYFSYSCDICGKIMGTNKAMEVHKSMYHAMRSQPK